jgi:hypothetical protein
MYVYTAAYGAVHTVYCLLMAQYSTPRWADLTVVNPGKSQLKHER